MSAATDTFSRFVDVLASTLDAHETTAEELASRTRLSRYHFDRLVAAAAGEPPHAFRRRILLERAAYRLAVTDDSVLAIAIDARLRVARSLHAGVSPPLRANADATLRSQLARLVGQMAMWNAAIAGEEYDVAGEEG